PPPSSTLFPYTTLFRSMVGFPPAPRRMRWWFFLVRGAPFSVAHQSRSVIGGILRLESIAIPVRVYFMNKIRVNLAHFAIGFISQDRKSTRLNSSHVSIS